MPTFFTSDTHFGHVNILKHAGRPFTSVAEMDEAMIANWNRVVAPGDTVYHLGDFSWGSKSVATYLRRLNGNIHIIFGNHDKGARQCAQLFKSAADYREISVEGQKITLCHYAMRTFNKAHYGAWQLYGHSHGSLPEDSGLLSTDVGVDCWNYTPVSLDKLRSVMSLKTFKPVDHHGKPVTPK
jgi:calcineurin-like phosphoesterase family protein